MSDTTKTESLHDQIMRLSCTPPKDANVNQMLAYKSGHRDARHAAAELAAAHEAEQAAPVAVPDENGLLPCPFCGGNAELHQRETESLWSHNQVTWSQVGCCECECVGADCCEDDDGSEAVAHWNTRAADPAAPTPPAQQSQWAPSRYLPTEDMRIKTFGTIRGDNGSLHFEGFHFFGDTVANASETLIRCVIGRLVDILDAHRGDTAAPEQAEQPHPVNRSVIRDVFLRNGFTIKEGHDDLKPYVYAAAEELLALDGKEVAAEQDAVKLPRELLCRITRNGGVDTLLAIDELRALLGGGA